MLPLNFVVLSIFVVLLLVPNLPFETVGLFEKGPNSIVAELLTIVIVRETNLLTELRGQLGAGR